MTRETNDWNAPGIFHLGVDLHSGLEDRHLLHRAHDRNGAPVIIAHEIFAGGAPTRNSRDAHACELIRQSNEFVGQESAADKAGIAVAVVADRNGCAGAKVVVSLLLEEAGSAGVCVTLQVSSNPVVAVSQSVGESATLGIQQQASRLRGGGRDNYEIGGLFLQATARIKVGDAGGASAISGENFFGDALRAQLAVAGLDRLGMTVF